MNASTRLLLLRVNALWLGGTATLSLLLDIQGIFFGRGATAQIVAAAPHSGAAFLENHALQIVLAGLLWRARARFDLHVAAAVAMAVLGTANLLFWPIYAAMGAVTMGYVTTSVHWMLAAAQLAAAASKSRPD